MKTVKFLSVVRPFLLILIFFQFFFSSKLLSQNYSEDFKITFLKKRVSNGYYNTINFIDSRNDSGDLGFVYSGPGNKKVPVIAKTNLGIQIKDLLKYSIDSSNADGELLFQLRKFKFLERPETASEFGFCLFRADLYVKQDCTYKKLNRIDTIIIVEAPEVTKPLFEETGNAITEFLLKNLSRDFSNTENFTHRQIIFMDSVEKSRLKLYSEKQLTDGLYNTYISFKNQIPDFKILEVVYKKEKISYLKAQNLKNKNLKINPDEFYAFVFEGKPYISAEYNCYPLEKKDNDFYFTGEGKIPKDEAVYLETTAGTDVSKLANPAVQTGFYLIKIDHIDGSLMRIKEVKNY